MTTPAPWTAQPAPADLGHPAGTWLILGPDTDHGEPHTVAFAPPCGDGPHPETRAQADAELVVGLRNGAVEIFAFDTGVGGIIPISAADANAFRSKENRSRILHAYRTEWQPLDEAPTAN